MLESGTAALRSLERVTPLRREGGTFDIHGFVMCRQPDRAIVAADRTLWNTAATLFSGVELADDVAVTKRALAAQDGPAILVGHSYGGAIITEAGTHPNVAALVYIAAFAPDKGESVSTLIANPAPGAPVPPILPPQDGFLFLDKTKFRASFAADVDEETASFMAHSQVPWGVAALGGTITDPAWRSRPTWYLVATQDRMIPPEAQRLMSRRAGAMVVEVAGSHSIYMSQPQAVAALIATAAKEAAVSTR